VLGQVPGELAPKLALALACERTGDFELAEQLYAVCAATDANYVAPAAFGLARTRERGDDQPGALAALDLVAPTSSAYTAARRRRAELLTAAGPGLDELAAAAASIDGIAIDPRERLTLQAKIFEAALDSVGRNGDEPSTHVGPAVATEQDLRAAAEHAYRELATLTADRAERTRLVDAANAVRPRTLV
jgi:serine/threonine-protein kinase PknG